MDPTDLTALVISALFVTAGMLFVVTGSRPAPYGRYAESEARLGTVPTRLAWFLMALPGLLVFGHVAWHGPAFGHFVPTVLMGFWLAHYAHRCLVYPLQLNTTASKRFSLLLMLAGIVLCAMLSYVNARAVAGFGREYTLRWLWSIRFLYGSLLFTVGFAINRYADWVLCRLGRRHPGERPLPRGGVFEEITCPNYLGELLMWLGWGILTWSAAGFATATLAAAVLIPRAYSHHLWSQRMHRNYPLSRRAIIPMVL